MQLRGSTCRYLWCHAAAEGRYRAGAGKRGADSGGGDPAASGGAAGAELCVRGVGRRCGRGVPPLQRGYPPPPPTCTKVNQPPRRLSLPGCPTRPLLAGPVTPRAPTWAAGLWWQVGYGLMVCGSATPTVSLCTVSRCSQVTPPLPPGPHRRNVCTHNLKTHECT